MNSNRNGIGLTARDHGINAVQAGILAIPVVGSPLEKLIFGAAAELRMRRVESTLKEIGDILKEQKLDSKVEDNEDFANLLEQVTPALGRSTSEDKRERFRDLLLNATQTQMGDADWADARLASRYLEEIDEPGLAILAGLRKLAASDGTCEFAIVKNGCPPCIILQEALHAFYHSDDFLEAGEPFSGDCHDLGFSSTAIDIWADKLIEIGLVLQDEKQRAINIEKVRLTDRGEMLIRWTTGPKKVNLSDLGLDTL